MVDEKGVHGGDGFQDRHIGPRPNDVENMLRTLGYKNLEQFISKVVPSEIRTKKELELPPALSEFELLKELKTLASENKVFKSWIGAGYSNCIVPSAIKRNL